MYWQKKFHRKNLNQEVEEEIESIRNEHKNYGYRGMTKELENRGYCMNKKKVQRLIQRLGLQVRSYTHKSLRYSSYKGSVGHIAKNMIRRRFYTPFPSPKNYKGHD